MTAWFSSIRQGTELVSDLTILITSALQLVECKVTKPKTKQDKVVSRDGVRRLVNEYKQISRHPIPNVLVHPKEEDIYTCYFVILGTTGDYKVRHSVLSGKLLLFVAHNEGGKYLGCLELPPQYPMAPPRVWILFRPACDISFLDYVSDAEWSLWDKHQNMRELQVWHWIVVVRVVSILVTTILNYGILLGESNQF